MEGILLPKRSIGYRDIKLLIENNKFNSNKKNGIFFRNEKHCGDYSIIRKNKFINNSISINNNTKNIIIKNNLGYNKKSISKEKFIAGYKSYKKDTDNKHLIIK